MSELFVHVPPLVKYPNTFKEEAVNKMKQLNDTVDFFRWKVDQQCAEARPSSTHPCDGNPEKRWLSERSERRKCVFREMAELECIKIRDNAFKDCHAEVKRTIGKNRGTFIMLIKC